MDNTQDLVGGGGGDGGGKGRGKRGYLGMVFLHCVFILFFSVMVSFLFSFLLGLVAVAFGAFSNWHAVSIPTDCRIVSSGVDLRSSKVCELGVSNYNTKHIFYSWEKTRVRCRDDYYWASIFKVEYKDYFSGRVLHAIAEAPKEALPLDCRPTFGTAWLTKSKFKVNETYKCRYTPGILKADIYQDDLFNCQAKEPSNTEMIRRILILSLDTFSLDNGRGKRMLLAAVTGIVIGMLIAVCLLITLKVGDAFRLSLIRKWDAGKHYISILSSHLKRACFLVAYFSVMGWLTLQYSKMIGLKQ